MNHHTPQGSARNDSAVGPAVSLVGAGRIQMRDREFREPGRGEVRVRLEGCGICASNLGPWAGPEWMSFPTPPGDLGHEGWGTIDALGDGVDGWQRGQRVACLFYRSYAAYDVGPASHLVAIPAALAGKPVPGEPLGCAINIAARSALAPGQRVAIVGVGFLGALLIQLAKSAGAHVTAVSRRGFARQVAERCGADQIFAADGGWPDGLQGESFDCAIEATGKQAPLDLAAALVRIRGRLVIAGYHQDGPRQVDMQSWNWRGIDVVNAHEREPSVYVDGIRKAVGLLATGRLDLEGLITHSFPLAELGEALNATRDRPDGFLKAVVTM